MSNQSPFELLKQQMAKTAAESATRVGSEVANHAAGLVKNAATEALDGIFGKNDSVKRNPSTSEDDYEAELHKNYSKDEDVIDVTNEEDEDLDDNLYDDSQRELPLAFSAYGKVGNFEAAVAAWKLWGRKHETKYDEPDIVVVHCPTGTVFAGSFEEYFEYCEQNNLDDEWEFFGAAPSIQNNEFQSNFNPNELEAISISKDSIMKVMKQVSAMPSKESDEKYKGFHWNDQASVTRVIADVQGLEGQNLIMLGVAESIIYTAKKGKPDGSENDENLVQTFIHEFGEDSGLKPILYCVNPPDGSGLPKTLVISGGKMRVENRGIVD